MVTFTAHQLFEAFSDMPRSLDPVRDQIRGQKVLFVLHSDDHNPPSEQLTKDLRIWLAQNGASEVVVCSCQDHDTWRCASNQRLREKMTCVCACHRRVQAQVA